MSDSVSSNTVGPAFCKALGLGDVAVAKIVITLEVDKVATVVVTERHLSREHADKLIEVLRHYELREPKQGEGS